MTDRQTPGGKTICLPTLKGEDIIKENMLFPICFCLLNNVLNIKGWDIHFLLHVRSFQTKEKEDIQSNFNGLNIFGTMDILF